MKKINLRGISEILSEKELKNVMGEVEKVTYYQGILGLHYAMLRCQCTIDLF